MKRIAIAVAALVFGLGLFGIAVIGRGGEDQPGPLLAALLADPMATYVPPGAKTVRTRDRDAGSTLGKPNEAVVSRDHQVASASAEAAFAATRAEATKSGWRFSGRPDHSHDALGDRVAVRAERALSGDQVAVLTVIKTDTLRGETTLASGTQAIRVTLSAR